MECRNPTRLRDQFVTFITVQLRTGIRAMIDMFEFEDIVDSSSASVGEFCAIAEAISYFYDGYDGFVVIHGTDTLSYAASFLSFMVAGLTVPVVFTGSMLPMVTEGSDAESNLIGAIESSLLVDSPSVYLYFNGWLHQGVRTTKISSDSFDSFYSTNPVGIGDLEKNCIENIASRKRLKGTPYFYMNMSRDVGIFKIFPYIHPYHFKAALSVYKAVILETYGSGTMPSNRKDLLCMISDYIGEGGVAVNVSQCADGNVSETYKASNVLTRLGVLPARNMTTEAAFAKLSLLVANYPYEIEQWFQVSLCGEIDN